MQHQLILAMMLVATLIAMTYYCQCHNTRVTATPNRSVHPNKHAVPRKARCYSKNDVTPPQRWAVSNDKIRWLVSKDEDYFGPEGATISDGADLHLGWVPDHDILRS